MSATTSSASMSPPDATAAASSSVRETFTLVSSLIYPRIPVRYLELCARILQRRHLDAVFEERAVQLLCALPSCGNKLSTYVIPACPLRLVFCQELAFAVRTSVHLDACGNLLGSHRVLTLDMCSKTGKYRVSLARKEIYDAQYENKFCSQRCLQVRVVGCCATMVPIGSAHSLPTATHPYCCCCCCCAHSTGGRKRACS